VLVVTSREISGGRLKTPDLKAPPDSWGEREIGYRFGKPGKWAVGLFSVLGRGVPEALFIFFLFSFLFLFSKFFHIICKNASNQFKPLSEIFEKSMQ
jgi:hypothetical protein